MKLERMLSIITYLLNHEKVKAQELAEKFEVSVRTIYRDVDAIAQAGIPIVTYQGVDGGIGIIDGYKLDKSLLTQDEVSEIVTGLKGLHSINEDVKIKFLIEKLSSITNKSDYVSTGNEIMIDLSPWNANDRLALRIQELKKAIRKRKIIEFTYCSNEKITERKVEPYVIVFKAANWYLYAYCLLRQDFRLFKLRRISEMAVTDTGFEVRECSIDKVKWDGEFANDKNSPIVVVFDRSLKLAVSDIFGVENYQIMEDGRLKVSFNMEVNDWLCGFILGFGDKIEVVEPSELINKIKNIAQSVYRVYEKKE
ncbi:MAG TPA: transcriptional regulator [Firmicutes bacterium]|jgi:predicted DNA-binding transcriptional regulator YafY|nr:transcriptional regulator [Bacillota bacterium]